MEQTALTTQPANGKPLVSTTVDPHTGVITRKRHLAIPGLEALTIEDDLILPRWRLTQDSSKISDNAGIFHNNLTEEERDFLDLVILNITPSRAYFNKLRELVCMSRNALQSTSGQNCIGCEFAQWGEDNEPSICKRGYTFVCLDLSDKSLCLVGALSKAAGSAKTYFSKLNHIRRSPYSFITRFSSEFTPYIKGDFHLLQINTIADQTPEDLAFAIEQYQYLSTVNYQEVDEATWDAPGATIPHQPEFDGDIEWGAEEHTN